MKKQLTKQADAIKAGQFFFSGSTVFFADTAGAIWFGTPGYVPRKWTSEDGDPEVDNLTNAPTEFQLSVTAWLDWITPIVAEANEEEAAKP